MEDQRFWDALGRKLLALLFAAAGTGRHIADVVRWVDYRAEDEVQDLLDTLGDPDAIAAWAANRAGPGVTSRNSTRPAPSSPIEPPRRSPRTAVRPTPSSPTASGMPWTGRGRLRGPRTCSSTAAQPLPASPQRRAADEARLHLVPVVMGAGTPLFDGVRSDVRFVPSDATSSPLTTHLTYCRRVRATRVSPGQT